jgi:FlaA1/EpsC-like NDP-sugar epimerase
LISEFAHRRRQGGDRLVIYGAGDGAAATARELLKGGSDGYRMLGFIDDDPDMARKRIQGYPVLGDFASLESLIANGAVDSVVITTRLIDVNRLERLKTICEAHQVSLARLHVQLDHLIAVS